MMVSYGLLFGQVNSMYPKILPIKSNSIYKDFEFVGRMFVKAGKNIEAGIVNGAKNTADTSKKCLGN